jgi:hypothetical protein
VNLDKFPRIRFYIHFDFDNWDADMMEDDGRADADLNGLYHSYRMIP